MITDEARTGEAPMLLNIVAGLMGVLGASAIAGGIIFINAGIALGFAWGQLLLGVASLALAIAIFTGNAWAWYVTLIRSAAGVIVQGIALLTGAKLPVWIYVLGLGPDLLIIGYFLTPRIRAHFAIGERYRELRDD